MRLRRLVEMLGVDAALVLAVVIVLGPIVADDSAQPASRFTLTAALAEHHSVDISRYKPVLGVDYSVHNGLRSDKAPGQSFFAVPAYFAARAVGGEPASVHRVHKNLTLWFVTFWSSTLPFALLLVVMRRTLARITARYALLLTLAFAGGALVLPYGVNLYGHLLAALLGFSAWSCIERVDSSERRFLLGGLLAGAAVFVEYQAVAIAVVLFVFALRRSQKYARAFVAGALPFVLALGCYEWVAFGAPWRLPYSTYRGHLDGTVNTGLRNSVRGVAEIIGSGHGLVLTAPLVLVAVLAGIALLRHPDERARTHASVALAVFAAYLLVVGSFAGSQLIDVPGPRFIIPALPFAMLPLAWFAERLRVAVVLTAAWGTLLMAAATWTVLVVPDNAPLVEHEQFVIQHHEFAPTLWSIAAGRLGDLGYVIACGAAVGAVAVAARPRVGAVPPTREQSANMV